MVRPNHTLAGDRSADALGRSQRLRDEGLRALLIERIRPGRMRKSSAALMAASPHIALWPKTQAAPIRASRGAPSQNAADDKGAARSCTPPGCLRVIRRTRSTPYVGRWKSRC